jgi:hypothetical protein
MKLLSVLKETIVSDKKIISEISASRKNTLIKKFSGSTNDSVQQISSYIDEFEDIKNGLPADRRDILRYSYDELKNVISQKKTSKNIDSIFDEFKKREKSIPNDELKKYIKRFLEISSKIPKNKSDILSYNFLDLAQFINENYPILISKLLLDKFTKEDPNLTVPQVTYYIQTYLDYLNEIPSNIKKVDEMSFTEFEHLIDGIAATKNTFETKKDDYDDIDLRYNENNLKIFAPKTKDQCIKLRNNRTWCTSREGSGNLYYNYRLSSERTLYYVIDEDKDFNDLNFAVVILVDPDGGMSLADKSNTGDFSGHRNLPWDMIVKKIPKLKNLKQIFKPEPLTKEEKELISKVQNVKVGDDPKKSFSSLNELEMWLEYNSPRLTDIQYINLPLNLKKKYITLGMDLTSEQLRNSEPEILQYYIRKKEDKLKNTTLTNLSDSDISLLNIKLMRNLKESLKEKFKSDTFIKKDAEEFNVVYPDGVISKFITLYGFDEIFEDIPPNIRAFIFKNKSKTEKIILKLPDNIYSFTELETLVLENCINELPSSIGNLKKVTILTLSNNTNLKELPDSILNMDGLSFINLENTKVEKFPEKFFDYFQEELKKDFYIKKF